MKADLMGAPRLGTRSALYPAWIPRRFLETPGAGGPDPRELMGGFCGVKRGKRREGSFDVPAQGVPKRSRARREIDPGRVGDLLKLARLLHHGEGAERFVPLAASLCRCVPCGRPWREGRVPELPYGEVPGRVDSLELARLQPNRSLVWELLRAIEFAGYRPGRRRVTPAATARTKGSTTSAPPCCLPTYAT